MIKNFISFLIIILGANSFIQNAFASPFASPFYKNHEYNNFIKMMKAFPRNDQRTQNFADLFIIRALKLHPDYKEKLEKDLKKYPKIMQKNIQNALQCIVDESGDTIDTNSSQSAKDLSLCKKVEMMDKDEFNIRIQSEEDAKYAMLLADYCWLAFDITGDDKYLIKILNFLSSEELLVKTLAFEMENRIFLSNLDSFIKSKCNSCQNEEGDHLSDLMKDIERFDPSDKQHIKLRMVSYRTVLWSLQSNCKQSEDISNRVKKLIETYPELDFAKGVEI